MKVKFCGWRCFRAQRVRLRLSTETVCPAPTPQLEALLKGGRGGGSCLTHLCVPGAQHRPGPELTITDLVVNGCHPWEQSGSTGLLFPFWACGCITATPRGTGARSSLNVGWMP